MNKLWGGRFQKKTNKLVEEFTNSLRFDQKLARYDCLGSLLHIKVLRKAGLINSKEFAQLQKGLTSIKDSIENGSFFKKIDLGFEDIHSYIQTVLEQKAGKAALKLHTCRSRNDQVSLATKLYCLEESKILIENLHKLDSSLQQLAEANNALIIPGFTHLQHAIPVRIYDYFFAYHQMFLRDKKRIEQTLSNIHPTLGSGALAGTMIESDCYHQAIENLSHVKITSPQSALDTVSDRDFVIDLLHALSIIGLHLSRLAEDLILWCTKEFDFIDIDESFCTGSSLMPQKKNPDVLELVRGYTGRLYGNYQSVMVMMKGLPLSYNRDMQHDKEPLFDSIEIVQKELAVMAALLQNITFKRDKIEIQLDDETLYATDMADHLVKKGMEFKKAHHIIGELVQYKIQSGQKIVDMDNQELSKVHPLLKAPELKKIIDPKHSVDSKKSVKKVKWEF